MIELLCRAQSIDEFGYWHHDDTLLYRGNDRDEAQRVFAAHDWLDNEVGIWIESGRRCEACDQVLPDTCVK